MKKSWFLGFMFLFLFSFALVYSEDEGSTEVTITTGTTGIACYSNSTDSYIYNASKTPREIINWTFTSGSSPTQANCSLSVGHTGSFCCPTGYSCDFDTGECISGAITECRGFLDEQSCIYSPSSTSVNWFKFLNATLGNSCNGEIASWESTDGSVQCQNSSSCKCFWNTTGSSGRCDPLYEVITPTHTSCGPVSNSQCYYSVGNETNNCDNALAKISVTYVPYGNAAQTGSCQTQTLDYPCSVSVKLPFFNWFSFILTGFAIALIYFVSFKSRSS